MEGQRKGVRGFSLRRSFVFSRVEAVVKDG